MRNAQRDLAADPKNVDKQKKLADLQQKQYQADLLRMIRESEERLAKSADERSKALEAAQWLAARRADVRK